MITELSFHNWKSFERSTLKVDQLTFIIGTNAAGKSNIVDALQFLSRVGSGERLIEICKGIRGGADKIIRKGCAHAGLTVRIKTTPSDLKTERTYDYHIAFSIGDKDAFIVQEKLTQDPDSRPKVLFETEESSSQKLTNQITAKFLKDKPGPRKGVNLRSDVPIICQVQGINVLKEIKTTSHAILNALSSIFVLDPNPSAMRNFSALGDRLLADGSNVAGVLAAMDKENKQKTESALTGYVKGLPEKDLRKIWAEPVGRFEDVAMLYCQEQWDEDEAPHETDARSMSDGTLRFIAIITALLTMPSDSLLIVEEVDNGVHPSRASELVDAIERIAGKGNFDVICTTHNPVLIDVLPYDVLQSVCCVTREGAHGSSKIVRLTDRPDFTRQIAFHTPGQMMTDKGSVNADHSEHQAS